ncbi:MAG: VPLPA-CTERM sorting domain-containing protein [Pseudomonadota bacterium]
MKTYVLTAVALLALASSAFASTIRVYDESIDGDASNWRASATELGMIGAGETVTVIGSVDEAANDKTDFYAFSVAIGYTVSLSDIFVSAGTTGWRLFRDDGVFNWRGDRLASVDVSGVQNDLFGSVAAGSYFIRVVEKDEDVSANYTFNIEANSLPPVPLPAGLSLLIGGIGALAFLRRRKSA